MTDTLMPRLGTIDETHEARALDQAGAATFADLAWSHWWWEHERHSENGASPQTEAAYLSRLNEFEKKEGKIVHAYWSTRAASAVAMTEKEPAKKRFNPFKLRQDDREIRIHRLTDWLMHEPELADLLQQCDVMAVKAGELLRGGGERIVMRWILGVMEHILGFIERTRGNADAKQRKDIVECQQLELKKIEDFYVRSGGQAGRIVYFGGMLIGTFLTTLLALVAAALLWATGAFDGGAANELGLVFLCYSAGAVGALVSVMSRLRPGGNFDLDFEVGRPLIRRLGLFRPAVGAVFGLLLYAVLESGLFLVDPTAAEFPGDPVHYFAVTAFIAGFSERWVHVVIGGVQRVIAPDSP
jgi:hypothetical protein